MISSKPKTVKQAESLLGNSVSKDFIDEFSLWLRIRHPLVFLQTKEESRLIDFLSLFCKAKGYKCLLWDCHQGLIDLESLHYVNIDDEKNTNEPTENIIDPIGILDYILDESKSAASNVEMIKKKSQEGIRGYIYVLLDYFRFVDENPEIERRLKSIGNLDGMLTTVVTGPQYTATNTLDNIMHLIEMPYPNRDEIKNQLYQVVNNVVSNKAEYKYLKDDAEEMEEQLIDSVMGLTLSEAQLAFSKSIVSEKQWNIKKILAEKKQIINKSGILDYYDVTTSIKDVGGLHNLTDWIFNRKMCFSKEAQEYGIESPKGILTIGLPGCGKSLVCKAIANSWGLPLLKMDFGRLFGSLVGESESNAREAFKLAEAVSPCIFWIDEIEKGLSGVESSGRTDGGTTSRVLSSFLTWMQEKTKPVFVVATANNHTAIPPEFLRAGRFDEIFFVDLPNLNERKEIFEALFNRKKLDVSDVDFGYLSSKCNNYSGAEIEKAINSAMIIAFADNKRKITQDDIEISLKSFKPLFEMRTDDFQDLRQWAKHRCIKANKEEDVQGIVNRGQSGGNLDLS